LAIADRLSVSYHLLRMLSDIDRPEDLVHLVPAIDVGES
jgi:glycosyltransferase A (GT-A) superfamily protein (DUF2064 family)